MLTRTWLNPRICLGVIAACTLAFAAGAYRNKESGSDPYTPTKLEWLAVEVNSRASVVWPTFIVTAVPHYPDTLVLRVNHARDMDRQIVRDAVEPMHLFAEICSEYHEWDSWLVIKEDISPIEKPMTISRR